MADGEGDAGVDALGLGAGHVGVVGRGAVGAFVLEDGVRVDRCSVGADADGHTLGRGCLEERVAWDAGEGILVVAEVPVVEAPAGHAVVEADGLDAVNVLEALDEAGVVAGAGGDLLVESLELGAEDGALPFGHAQVGGDAMELVEWPALHAADVVE